LRAAKIIDQHIARVLPGLSFAEQQAFIDTCVPVQLNRLLLVCDDDATTAPAYAIFVKWKGLLIEAFRRQSAVDRLGKEAALKPDIDKLLTLRQQIAAWYVRAGAVPFAEWSDKNRELCSEVESIERKLAA